MKNKTKITYKDYVLKIEEGKYISDMHIRLEQIPEVIKVLSKAIK